MSETNQCIAIILRTGERCKKRHIGENYCIYHGPFCQALTLKLLPCNSMVRKFREGFIYCDLHEKVSIERFSGPHSSATPTLFKSKTTTRDTFKPDLKGQFTVMTTTITTTTTTTTTTTKTISTEELSLLLERVELSKKEVT